MPKELLSVVERQCKALIKTVGTYMMPKLFSYGLNFLLIPVLTRVLTPADLGIVALAWAVHNTLAGVCSLGIPGAVSRYYFEYRKDDQKLASLIVSSRWVMYGLLIVSTVVMAIFCGPLALMVGVDKSFADAFFWIFITAYINQVMSLYLNLFQNMERPFAYSLWLCVQAGVGFSLTLIFIFIFHLSYMGMVFGALFGAVIACAGASWHLREFNAGRWSQETMRENVIYGLSITPKSLSSFVNRFFDKYMLNNILSLAAVGIYNVGQSFTNALSVGITSMQAAFQPRWFKEVFDHPEEARVSTGRMFMLFSYLAMFPMLAAALLVKPFVELMLPVAYHHLTQIAAVLLLGLAPQLFGMFVGVQYAYAKKAYLIFPITIVGTTLNVVANIILIPKNGIMGAAWSGVIAAYSVNMLMVIVGQMVYRIEYPWKWLVLTHVLLWVAVLGVGRNVDLLMIPSIIAAYVFIGVKSGVFADIKEQMA